MSYLNRPSGPGGVFRPPYAGFGAPASRGFSGNLEEFLTGCVTGGTALAATGPYGAAAGCLAAGAATAYMMKDNANAGQMGPIPGAAGPSAQQAAQIAATQAYLTEEKRKKDEARKKMWTWIGVGAGVLVIGGGIYFATR